MLLCFLLSGIFVVTCAQNTIRHFHFVNLNLSWAEALQFCRRHYTDLAVVANAEEMNKLLRPASYSGDAWIGLHNIAVTYDKWAGSTPSNSACTGFYSYGPATEEWFHYYCSVAHYFVCYDDTPEKKFVSLTIGMSWPDARAYCRRHHTDLALIESKEENDLVAAMTAKNSLNSWIGWDSRTSWRWSDGSWPDFTHWMSGRPLDVNNFTCVAEDQSHFWKEQSCDQTLPFFCYKDMILVKNTFVRMSFSSSLDLSDPENYNAMAQKIQDMLIQKGLSGVNVIWKSPPKNTTETSLDDVQKMCTK